MSLLLPNIYACLDMQFLKTISSMIFKKFNKKAVLWVPKNFGHFINNFDRTACHFRFLLIPLCLSSEISFYLSFLIRFHPSLSLFISHLQFP